MFDHQKQCDQKSEVANAITMNAFFPADAAESFVNQNPSANTTPAPRPPIR